MKPEKTIEKLTSGEPVVIVALGDSLTSGWMVSKGYIDYLKEMIRDRYPNSKLNLINRGIPGDTARGGVDRLQNDVLRHNPDCVIIQFGLNDAFAGYSHERYREHIEMMIHRIRDASSADIILVTSVCLNGERDNAFIDKFYLQVEELSHLFDLPFAPVHRYWMKKIAEGVTFDSLVQFDGVHPNTVGHRLMAESIIEVF
ncbi:MAG: hypothetical protein JW736_07500 [Deltaproteobacteria bacterium]|nr:hypothetical protein [Deltaproteobacteria bacterium]MBN2686677.1 hypothetical protein [Deltaproteobacteria bacterium]